MASKLDLIDAQFLGFFHGKYCSTKALIRLVESSGMTKAEWKRWMKTYPRTSLTKQEIQAIDEHFGIVHTINLEGKVQTRILK